MVTNIICDYKSIITVELTTTKTYAYHSSSLPHHKCQNLNFSTVFSKTKPNHGKKERIYNFIVKIKNGMFPAAKI